MPTQTPKQLLAAIPIIIGIFISIGVGNIAVSKDIDLSENYASGGATTRVATNRMAYSLPAANMPKKKLRQFYFGNRLFNTNWVTAPASVKSFDGLGPLFNRVSCSGCHLRDGRGRPPVNVGDPMLSMLIRLSVPGKDVHGGPKPVPNYGGQLNERAIDGLPAEGFTSVTYRNVSGKFEDGTIFSLQKPDYKFSELAYGALPNNTLISPRVAPAVFGLGLLEAIPETIILEKTDPKDTNHDGISGKANRVWDQRHQELRLGRFGWKANQPNLWQQNVAAFLGDIGITSRLFQQQNCNRNQVQCKQAVDGGTPEISDEFLKKLEFYIQSLAVPARRDKDDPGVIRGERIFSDAGCNACHTSNMMTGEHTNSIIANQPIQPFTDLLLHDMGEELSDGRPDFAATGSEWRTPPLWGIGLQKTVNGHSRVLHDGRARSLSEAILWHGGEGKKSQVNYLQMSVSDRTDLLTFLKSL